MKQFWVNLSLRGKGLIAVMLPLLALLVSGLFTAFTLHNIQKAERLVAQAQDIQIAMQDVHNQLLSAGAGVRGYLLTGDNAFLTLFHEAENAFPAELGRVARLLESNQVDTFDRVRAQVEQEFAALSTMLDYATVLSQDAPDALNGLVVTSQVVMDGLNTQFAQLKTAQQRRLEAREAARRRAIRRFYAALASNVLVGIIGGLISVQLFSSGVTRRVRVLEGRAVQLASGNTLIREPHSHDELGQLALTLERTSDLLLEREMALKEANGAAFERLERLTQSSRRMALLNRLGTALQRCQQPDEAVPIIEANLAALMPEAGGALYLLDTSLGAYILKAQWGQVDPEDLLTADACRASDQESHYLFESQDEAYCRHSKGERRSMAYCRSLTSKGQRLGLVQLSGSQALSPELRQTCDAMCDYVALFLANLQLRDSLVEQATRDPLTGLFNRRYLSEQLAAQLEQASRRGQALSIILADIDHFKSFNDRLGHQAGDEVLKAFAEVLRGSFRAEDTACRYGGEEFIVMLPGTSLEDAERRAERLRLKVRELKPVLTSDAGQAVAEMLSVSVGVAGYPQHGARPDVLIEAADAALYRAKNQGRDQVVTAPQMRLRS